jgi:hypothetical protein
MIANMVIELYQASPMVATTKTRTLRERNVKTA